jgi:hypothetical protein
MQKPDIQPWGNKQSFREFQRGYLLGALVLNGMFGRFYQDPLIILSKQTSTELANMLMDYCRVIPEPNRLVPAPSLIEYATDGLYGIECPSLRELAERLLAPRTLEPLPAFYSRSSRLLCGFIAAAVNLHGEIRTKSVGISIESPAKIAALQKALTSLGIASAIRQGGITVRRSEAVQRLYEWIPELTLTRPYGHH